MFRQINWQLIVCKDFFKPKHDKNNHVSKKNLGLVQIYFWLKNLDKTECFLNGYILYNEALRFHSCLVYSMLYI